MQSAGFWREKRQKTANIGQQIRVHYLTREVTIAGFQCHAKLNIKTVQKIKSRIWEKKEGNYAKVLAKVEVTTIFLMRDMRRSFLPKFIEICMETPCWCPSGWAPTWRPETNRNIRHKVLL